MDKKLIKFLSSFILSQKRKRKFRREAYYYLEEIIISRTACLGNFSLDKIDLGNYKIVNCAKNRVDYCLSVHKKNKKNNIDADEILHYTKDEFKHLSGCYYAQERDVFGHKKVKAIIMDSFSELVDQLFIQKNGPHSFCSHYRSVKDTPIINLYDCYGKLDIELMYDCYIEFFDLITKIYKDSPTIFIHFPTKFEDRQEFKDRALAIEKIIKDLENKGIYNLVSIKPEIVERNPMDSLVYHFSDRTYQNVASQLVKVLNKYGVGCCLKSEGQADA